MRACKIVHNSEDRIKVEFPYNKEMVSRIREIPDARWSKTLGAWHIPNSENVYDQLIRLFPDIELPSNPIFEHCTSTLDGRSNGTPTIKPGENPSEDRVYPAALPLESTGSSTPSDEIMITVSGKILILKMPKNETDIQFVRTFKYVRWDSRQFRWVIPNYGKNLELLKNYFNTRISRIETILLEPPKTIPNFSTAIFINDLPKIDSESLQEIERFKQWMEQKRYSDSTVKTYVMAITTDRKSTRLNSSH